MIVVPNVMGICTWSPRLDSLGNSVRGIAFCKELVADFNFHDYDSLTVGEITGKRDPRRGRTKRRSTARCGCSGPRARATWMSSERACHRGNPNAADYDGRTALHLAASRATWAPCDTCSAPGPARRPPTAGAARLWPMPGEPSTPP